MIRGPGSKSSQSPPPPHPRRGHFFVPRSEALGTPRRQGLCSQSAHLWTTSDFVPCSEASGHRDTLHGNVWPFQCKRRGHWVLQSYPRAFGPHGAHDEGPAPRAVPSRVTLHGHPCRKRVTNETWEAVALALVVRAAGRALGSARVVADGDLRAPVQARPVRDPIRALECAALPPVAGGSVPLAVRPQNARRPEWAGVVVAEGHVGAPVQPEPVLSHETRMQEAARGAPGPCRARPSARDVS